ncbi:nucleoside recognition domain-containing protein [Paenibacillus ginsengihumi]|uniref:nucleoside recognition domain-containing protein n=1 Tax=Paenibacillus ginsengihumi TaxID=431596 RepID=UPI0003700B0B|nr:nucleoside recognition domain-containing protein [Paenibacillus ginsengihumi]
MSSPSFSVSPRATTYLLGAGALTLIVSIILHPDRAFQASLQGLTLWWKYVFPALLPFLMITEIMRGLGGIHWLGALMEPLLRTLLRLPGLGGWAIALGLTAGAPAGASAVGALRRDGHLDRDEAERLLAVSHLMSPVLMITVVGVGFLHDAAAGLALALIHYAAALLMMLLCRRRAASASGAREALPADGVFGRAFAALAEARRQDGRAFGRLLGDSVMASVQQLFVLGGYIMMFSVLLQMIASSGLLPSLSPTADGAGGSGGTITGALAAAFLEPHLGSYALSQTDAPGSWPYALLSLMLAWGGLSVHAQTVTLMAGTDLRYSRFLLARLIHGGIAFALTLAAWQPLMKWLSGSAPSAVSAFPAAHAGLRAAPHSLWPLISPMMLQFAVVLLLLLVLSVFAAFLFKRKERQD